MLKRLYISNFALIEEMDTEFPGQLTVITGETGAGKSIFIEALGLALGKRADLSALKQSSRKCIVEATFILPPAERARFADFLSEQTGEVVLRRELSADGRSRCFINDSLVSVAELKELSGQLIDIHSQHETLLLGRNDFQLTVTDAMAGTTGDVQEYSNQFNTLRKITKELEKLRESRASAMKQADYNRFLFSELEGLDLSAGQLEALEDEAKILENASLIQATLAEQANAVSDAEPSMLSVAARTRAALNGLSKYGKKYEALAERMNTVYVDLKDLAGEISSAAGEVSSDPERLEQINSRTDIYHRLLKKHGVKTLPELKAVRDEIENSLLKADSIDDEIVRLEKEAAALQVACERAAEAISVRRKKAAPLIEKKVKAALKNLSMEKSSFTVQVSATDSINANGRDEVRFMFSANSGLPESEISKTASGGELSRLMLALKSLLAEQRNMPAVVFDEIDTGVSGEVADRIGNLLLEMGRRMQVIVITHLPQMASKGAHHLFIYKEDDSKSTSSRIRELSGNERIYEIAKMLSTGNPTPTALSNARELLSYN